MSSQNASVVIIGAGIVGASVAYHLVQRGCTDVTILESGAALPSSVELVVKAPAKPAAGAKDVRVAQAAPSANAPSKPKAAVPPPASAAPPSSEPAVKRTF